MLSLVAFIDMLVCNILFALLSLIRSCFWQVSCVLHCTPFTLHIICGLLWWSFNSVSDWKDGHDGISSTPLWSVPFNFKILTVTVRVSCWFFHFKLISLRYIVPPLLTVTVACKSLHPISAFSTWNCIVVWWFCWLCYLYVIWIWIIWKHTSIHHSDPKLNQSIQTPSPCTHTYSCIIFIWILISDLRVLTSNIVLVSCAFFGIQKSSNSQVFISKRSGFDIPSQLIFLLCDQLPSS